MFYRTKSGLTLTKQSTIWKHYCVMAAMMMMLGFAVYGNVKQYLYAQTYEDIIKDKDQRIEVVTDERDEARLNLKRRIDKIKTAATAIRGRYPHVPTQRAMLIADLEITYSRKENLGAHYGFGISGRESGFDPKAVSYNGTSFGLKQVHYNVWKKEIPGLTMKCLMDIECNTKTGYRILAIYRDRNGGNMHSALMSYYGATNRDENIKYADRVFALAMYFKPRIG